MLDQLVIRVARKGEGIEPQRIHRRQPKKPEIGFRGFQMRKVEEDQVVAQQEVGTVREIVQSCQCRAKVTAAENQLVSGIRSDCGESTDATILFSDLEVQREIFER